jgi:hypothetical protein
LRRASLPGELAARTAPIGQLVGPPGPVEQPDAVFAYRPRARALAAPTGDALDRVRQLTASAEAAPAHADHLTLDPPGAAEHILATLRQWGYLTP